VGTARRQGARSIRQFEILPKPREWPESWNPQWPYWPAILRTSSSHEEGCERRWSVTTTGFSGRGVKVEDAACAEVRWVERGGRQSPQEVKGSEFAVKVDLVLLATGFLHVQHSRLLEDFGVDFDERGNVKLSSGYQTSVKGVFAAGDAGTGASLVVRAIWHGREAARAIDESLK
jgi:glutamate synthase (NADPH/NADH) small chain